MIDLCIGLSLTGRRAVNSGTHTQWPVSRLRKLADARKELQAANQLAEKHVADVEEGLHRGSRLLLLIKADLDHLHKHSRLTPKP